MIAQDRIIFENILIDNEEEQETDGSMVSVRKDTQRYVRYIPLFQNAPRPVTVIGVKTERRHFELSGRSLQMFQR